MVYVSIKHQIINKLECKELKYGDGLDQLVELDVPQDLLNETLIQLSAGESNTCIILNRPHNNLVCQGRNRHGMNKLPDHLNQHVKISSTN